MEWCWYLVLWVMFEDLKEGSGAHNLPITVIRYMQSLVLKEQKDAHPFNVFLWIKF